MKQSSYHSNGEFEPPSISRQQMRLEWMQRGAASRLLGMGVLERTCLGLPEMYQRLARSGDWADARVARFLPPINLRLPQSAFNHVVFPISQDMLPTDEPEYVYAEVPRICCHGIRRMSEVQIADACQVEMAVRRLEAARAIGMLPNLSLNCLQIEPKLTVQSGWM